jgi:cytochrome c oxidase subunit 4
MHADPAEVSKSVRSYMTVFALLMVFTVITVAVASVDFAVPMAITVALIIASVKAAMVAGVFMHLNHEKLWVYGTLVVTVIFFLVLLLVPVLTSLDALGTGSPWIP